MGYFDETDEEVTAKIKLSQLVNRLEDNTCAENITWTDTEQGFITMVGDVEVMLRHPTNHGRTVPFWNDTKAGVPEHSSILCLDGVCVVFPVPNQLYAIVYNKHMTKLSKGFYTQAAEKVDAIIDELPDLRQRVIEELKRKMAT